MMNAADLHGVFVPIRDGDAVGISDELPEWLRETVRDAVMECHGDLMPNDMVYELCGDVWEWLTYHAEYGERPDTDDAAHMCADYFVGGSWSVYSEQHRWLAGDPYAREYCDDWACDTGQTGDIGANLTGGLYLRLRGIADVLGRAMADVLLVDSEPVGGGA